MGIRTGLFGTVCGALALMGVVVSASVAQAQSSTIPVNIQSDPAGAAVYLDTLSSVSLGVTPMERVRLPRGSHQLIFVLDEYAHFTLPIRVVRYRETFRATLQRLAAIEVNAAGESATGAVVSVNGELLGPVPVRKTLDAGRYLVEVKREGYGTFSQWMDVRLGQTVTLPVILEKVAEDKGSVLVSGAYQGTPVFLDGASHGVAPTVIDGVAPGPHVVELRPLDGMMIRQEVFVTPGQRATAHFGTAEPQAQEGKIRVLCNVAADVLIDGVIHGGTPLELDGLEVGEHIVELRAEGYASKQQRIRIEQGERTLVSMQLVAAVEGLAGGPVGGPMAAPVDTAAGVAGTAQVADVAVLDSDGAASQEVPSRTAISVTVDVGGAELWLNGRYLGPVPYEGVLPTGPHRLEVRREGYRTHVRQVQLTYSEVPREFQVELIREGELSSEEAERGEIRRFRQSRAAVSHAAAAIPQDQAVLDMSLGWPYAAEARLGVGIFDNLEGGFAVRSLFRLTEFEARAKLAARPIRQVSGAVQARIGGGLGPSRDATRTEVMLAPMGEDPSEHNVNSFFASLELLGSLHFSEEGAFTLWIAEDFSTDRYDWAEDDAKTLVVSDVSGAGTGGRDGRQNLARVRFGGALELVINRHWNAWGVLEGILLGKGRAIYGDAFRLGLGDSELYYRAGLTYKF